VFLTKSFTEYDEVEVFEHSNVSMTLGYYTMVERTRVAGPRRCTANHQWGLGRRRSEGGPEDRSEKEVSKKEEGRRRFCGVSQDRLGIRKSELHSKLWSKILTRIVL